MEAKGCAKPVQWKNARRHFHWAVRAQLAISAASAKLTAVSPQMPLEEAKRRVFEQIPQVPRHDDRAVAEALEPFDMSDVVAQQMSAHVTGQLMALVQSNRKAGLAGLVGVVNALTDEEKAALAAALQSSGSFPLAGSLVRVGADQTQSLQVHRTLKEAVDFVFLWFFLLSSLLSTTLYSSEFLENN